MRRPLPPRAASRALLVTVVLPVLAGCAPSADDGALEARLEALQVRVEILEERLASLPDEAGLAEAPLDELLRRLGSDDAVRRYRAVRELRDRGDAAWPDLFAILAGGEGRAREAAAAVLAMNATEAVSIQLLRAHEEERDVRTRALLATALARTDEADAIDALLGDLLHESRTVRLAATRGLGKMQAPRAAGNLLRAALGASPVEAAAATEALLEMDERALLFIATEWGALDGRQRADALDLLGNMRGTAVANFLREGLSDASPLVALHAARALARAGDPSGRSLARERLGSDDPVVARLAREVLDLLETND